ncbi:MAG TPA: peptidase MA family metallohydrolase [Anaerolineales bacterium]|jgi:hypothetical protein
MRYFVMFMLALTSGLASSQPVRAQQQTGVLALVSHEETYLFGQSITFRAQLILPSSTKVANLLFKADGEESAHVLSIQPDAQGNVSQTYLISEVAVRPFATVHYNYRVTLNSGEELTSDDLTFQYEDNRFTWQVLNQDEISVHWYGNDLSFGQAALDVAMRGIKKANQLVLPPQIKPMDIYIYASNNDLTQAVETGGITYVGGHASPDLHLALVSITPGLEQGLEMDQKIPHELAHILTYDLMPQRYTRLPVWLREGIASQAELAPNPDYPQALSQASEQEDLMPIDELCEAFPPETGRLFLAYAESESFTRFIIDKYGQPGLLALTNAYGGGLNCQQGMQQSLGKSLSEMEADWRARSLGEKAGLTAFTNLFPYLAILVVLLAVSLISAFSQKRPE